MWVIDLEKHAPSAFMHTLEFLLYQFDGTENCNRFSLQWFIQRLYDVKDYFPSIRLQQAHKYERFTVQLETFRGFTLVFTFTLTLHFCCPPGAGENPKSGSKHRN